MARRRRSAPSPGVRSITIDCPAERAMSYLLDARLPLFAQTDDAAAAALALSPSLLALGKGRDEILIGVQPLAEEECALHIVTAGESDQRAAGRKDVSAWVEGIRRTLEAATLQSTGAAS